MSISLGEFIDQVQKVAKGEKGVALTTTSRKTEGDVRLVEDMPATLAGVLTWLGLTTSGQGNILSFDVQCLDMTSH